MTGTTPSINLPTPPGGQLFASEAGLPQGSQPGQAPVTSSWSFTIKAEDGVDDLTVGGYAAIRDGVFTAGSIAFDYGRLSVTGYDPATGQVDVGFTLTAPYANAPGPQQKYGAIVSYDVALTDRDGDEAHSPLLLQIRDDEFVQPSSDTATVTAGAAVSGDLVGGGTPDRFGADGFGHVSRIATFDWSTMDTTADTGGRYSVAGKYGVLTVDPAGAFTYAASPDAPGGAVDRFDYWAMDGDGDEGRASIALTIQGGSPPSGGGGGGGQVYTSPGPGSTVSGGTGNDTLNASQGSDVLTGGPGADTFAWAKEPWSPATVTDFVVGSDRIDISALFRAAGYSGSDPVGDKYVSLLTDSSGTKILFDRDGAAAGQQWPNYIIDLQGVTGPVTWSQLSGVTPPPPASTISITAGPTSVVEGNSGITALSYTLARSGDTTGTASVRWTPLGSTDGADLQEGYIPSGTATFAVGETTKTVTVNLRGDTTYEPDEQLRLTLDQPSGAGLGTAVWTTTVRNDDAQPANPGQVYTSPGPGSTLTGGSGDDTLNASRGSDVLTGAAGADTFAWGAEPWSPATVTDFSVGVDRLDLSALFRASGYAGADPVADKYISFIQDSSGTKVLFDRDGAAGGQPWPNYIIDLQGVTAPVTWTQLAGSGGGPTNPPPETPAEFRIDIVVGDKAEGDAGATGFAFSIGRNSSEGSAQVFWTVAGAGANPASAADFVGGAFPTNGVSFGPGETRKIFAIDVAGDTTVEPDESFVVTLTNPTGGTIGARGSVSAVIRNDDGGAPPPADGGQVITSDQYGDTLTGGAGDDTLNAGQGPDKLIGSGGDDHFVFGKLPWNRGEISDFHPGEDLLDLSALAPTYAGADPVQDGWLEFRGTPNGVEVYVDPDGPGGGWPFAVTLLRGVSPDQLGPGDWVF